MKRIAYLLVVVMLLACLPLTVFAAKAGDEVTISFTTQNPGITGYRAIMNYDSSALQLVGVSVTAGTHDLNGNSVAVMSANAFNNSTLFTAKFKILDGAKAGETYYVTATCAEAYDENVEEISLSISGGSVKIDDCDHSWGAWTGTEATCGAAGHLTRTCSKCGATETDTPAATGNHKYEKDESASYDATCGKDGWLVEICSVCGDCKESTVPATGKHNIVKDTYNSYDATCGKDGKLYEFCSNDCGYTKVTTIPATGNHSNGTYTKIDGNDKQHKVSCSVCGKEDELENHSWDNGTVTTPATCGQPGSKTLTCTKCGYEKTEVIEANGKHTWGKWTEVDKDVHKHECSVCGESEEDEHNWDNGKVTTPATCVPGEKTYTCADCGATKVEAIDADPDKHDRETVKVWNKVDDNYHEGTCACGETIKEKHRWDKKDNGDGTQTWTCKDCKHSLTKEEDDVPDTGDITSQVMMTGAVALVVMMGAVALITKRKTAK